jgi:Mrp family chromosome partitioning ATPase
VLQLVGAGENVGASSLIVDYALLAIRERRRVLLLDLEPTPGRSDSELLVAMGAEVRPLPGARLGRVGDGERRIDVTLPHDSREIASGEANWSRLLDEARNHYDLVLIDAPALTRSRLGQILAPLADMTLVVVQAEKTRSPVALNVIERIHATGGEVTGSILNRRRFYIPARLYGWL